MCWTGCHRHVSSRLSFINPRSIWIFFLQRLYNARSFFPAPASHDTIAELYDCLAFIRIHCITSCICSCDSKKFYTLFNVFCQEICISFNRLLTGQIYTSIYALVFRSRSYGLRRQTLNRTCHFSIGTASHGICKHFTCCCIDIRRSHSKVINAILYACVRISIRGRTGYVAEKFLAFLAGRSFFIG